MSARRWWGSGLGIAGLGLVAAVANAKPPVGGASAPEAAAERVIGRMRLRGEVIDLSLSSLAAGGVASDLAEAYAQPVSADIDPALMRGSADDGADSRYPGRDGARVHAERQAGPGRGR